MKDGYAIKSRHISFALEISIMLNMKTCKQTHKTKPIAFCYFILGAVRWKSILLNPFI